MQRTYDLGAQQASLGAPLAELLRYVNHAFDLFQRESLRRYRRDVGVQADHVARSSDTALAAQVAELGLAQFAGRSFYDLLEEAVPGCVTERHDIVRAFVLQAAAEGFHAWERGEAFGDFNMETKRLVADLDRSFEIGMATNQRRTASERNRARRYAAEVRRQMSDDDEQEVEELLNLLVERVGWRIRDMILMSQPREFAQDAGITGDRLETAIEGLADYADEFIVDLEQDIGPLAND